MTCWPLRIWDRRKLRAVDLNQLVMDALGDFHVESKNRKIIWEIHPLPTVRADRALLRMALVNLISNAVKFTSGRAEAKIEIGRWPGDAKEAVIFIRDNGAGFDPEYAGKLFGVFQRLHGQNEFEGTGIGLANVQRSTSSGMAGGPGRKGSWTAGPRFISQYQNKKETMKIESSVSEPESAAAASKDCAPCRRDTRASPRSPRWRREWPHQGQTKKQKRRRDPNRVAP